ncbi:MAG: NADP-dependent oxidoreductase [Alphaproteobacteria bacterium]|nr:NADP-dependent oxidoreductase [Alphaproteobacteria bacterium]
MTALQLVGYGGPDRTRLTEVPRPSPGPGELLVQVAGFGLNPVDFKTRDGKLKTIYRPPLPVVLGNEFSGVVQAVGDDVTAFAVGDRVMARVDKERMGAFAEWAVVAAEHAARAPRSLPLVDAGGLPLAGLTALQALRDVLGVGPGFHVLITGGAGGVGTLAIQIAKILGAEVTTTASPRGRALVERLGADHVIDYTTTALSSVSERFDGVFDLIGGDTLTDCFGLVPPGATVVSVSGMPEPRTAREDLGRGGLLPLLFWFASWSTRRAAARHGATYHYMFMHPSGAGLAELAAWVDEGRLELVVDQRFPFAETLDAIAYLESGRAKGKVVVAVTDG